MDQELKQRLIGAAVVTALAAIFIPMLFDDPIDESGQMVSELTIPNPPATASEDAANKLPSSAAEVTAGTTTEGPDWPPHNQSPELPLQPSEKMEQDESFIEETGQPSDEQQWIEESADEEDSERITEDTGNDALDSQASDDDGALAPAATPDKIMSTPVKSPQKKAVSKLPPATPQATVQKPKVEAANSKARLVRWYVQAGSFGKKENALSRQEALRKQGLPVFMETQATDKGTFYRLKIGPELDKKRAIGIRDRLNKQNVKTIIVAE